MVNQAIFPGGDVGFEGSEPRRDTGDTFDEVLSRRIQRRQSRGAPMTKSPSSKATSGSH